MNKKPLKIKKLTCIKLKAADMEFYQDLIPKTKKLKSKLGASLLLILLVSLLSAQIYVNIKTEMSAINYFNIIIWVLWITVLGIQVFSGKRIESLFGKAYIHITDEFLKLKTSVFKKEQSIYWKDLSRLSMKPTFIKVGGQGGDTISIDFKNLEYHAVQDLKEVIKKLVADEKIKAD